MQLAFPLTCSFAIMNGEYAWDGNTVAWWWRQLMSLLVSGEAIGPQFDMRFLAKPFWWLLNNILGMIEEWTLQRLEWGLGTATSVNVERLILSPTRACVRGDYAVIVLHVSLSHGIHVPCIGHHTNTAGAKIFVCELKPDVCSWRAIAYVRHGFVGCALW